MKSRSESIRYFSEGNSSFIILDCSRRPRESEEWTVTSVLPIPADARRDTAADEWKAAYDALVNLSLLLTDWDGEGAFPPRAGLLAATYRLFQTLEKQSHVAPADVYLSADGTVVLEWHFEDGRNAIINVRVTDHAEVIRRTPNRNPEFSTIPIP